MVSGDGNGDDSYVNEAAYMVKRQGFNHRDKVGVGQGCHDAPAGQQIGGAVALDGVTGLPVLAT